VYRCCELQSQWITSLEAHPRQTQFDSGVGRIWEVQFTVGEVERDDDNDDDYQWQNWWCRMGPIPILIYTGFVYMYTYGVCVICYTFLFFSYI
jgi:hypothetical protein